MKPIPVDDAWAPLDRTGIIDPITWEGAEIPIRKWVCPGLIPYHVPTMISGMGGLGKTLLGLQLIHACASNTQWLGRDVSHIKTFGVLCEDDAGELQRRLHDINVGTNTRFGDLENMRLWVRDGEPASLVDFQDYHSMGQETQFYKDLLREAKEFGAELLLLDSLYNFFHGNENDRVHVTQFIFMLRRLAIELDAALVFIAHPSKSGISGGDGYAGSTAWHDAVRARLYLNEQTPPDGPKRLILETKKANYGPREGEIEVFYENGILLAKDAGKTSDPVYRKSHCDTTFLDCLQEVTRQGRHVGDSSNGSNYAPKIFTTLKCSRGFSRGDFKAAMDRLFGDGRLIRGEVMGKDRHKYTGLVEVKSGLKLGQFGGLDDV